MSDQDVRADVITPAVEVRRSARRRRTVTAYRDDDKIVVLLPQRMSKAEERVMVDDLVAKVLAREARSRAPRSDAALAARALDLSQRFLQPQLGRAPVPASVTWVGNQRQRWGSCTVSTRTIRLSDRLSTMPSWVVDYVLLHELVHLVEPNHSARFWRLVAAFPEAERARGFLDGYVHGQAARRGVTGDQGRGVGEIDGEIDGEVDGGAETDVDA